MSVDPVAARSTFLCTYMSNHPDTLVAYAAHYGRLTSKVSSAKMEKIEATGMTISYKLAKDEKVGTVRVKFDPPLLGYEEVRPRLTSMKLDAEEALGMSKAPPITTYYIPAKSLITVVLLIALSLTTWPPPQLAELARTTQNTIGGFLTIKIIWGVVAVSHGLEGLYTLVLCRRHSTGIVIGAAWVISVLLCGFPFLSELRKLIHRARIDSIAKLQ